MNKSQKIIITIMLLIMAFILIYPPVSTPLLGESIWLPNGRYLLLSFAVKPHIAERGGVPKKSKIQIDAKRLTIELLLIVCLGGATAILFDLKKKKK